MRLMRIGPSGAEKPVVRVDDDRYVDVSDVVSDFDEAFFNNGIQSLERLVADRIAAGAMTPFAEERIGSPIARPHQILCIGLNYRDHAEEAGLAVPTEPIVFTKSPNTMVGPNDDVRMPRGATQLDWEVELGIVIGRRCQYLESVQEAREAIAGFVAVNDVSERTFQFERGGQWSKGKSSETFNPTGPWLATSDEIADVGTLGLHLSVNGQERQNGSTSKMIFDPYTIVHYLSQFFVLEPGDLICTGTPAGVGMGFTPPAWLKEGDIIDVSVDGLGAQQQRVTEPR